MSSTAPAPLAPKKLAIALTCASAAVLGYLLGSPLGATPALTSLAAAQEESDEESGWGQAEVPSCNEQAPQDFLVRGNWQTKRAMERDEIRARREVHAHAVRYRTEQYGFFDGFGRSEWNPHPPLHYARGIRVFGRPVRLHERIIPAVRCAERAIALSCASTPYQPARLSGIRDRNTYHNGEVSNHVYGIALDIDPALNSCCGCVAPWPDHPLCRLETDDIFQRMAMPECWVRQFQRFGFYWLGDDRLMDTMHFEFLGDPERILATPGGAPAPSAPPGAPAPSGGAAH